MIKELKEKRTSIVLTGNIQVVTGDTYKIQLLAPGDILEVPVWGQAKRNAKGAWDIKGSASVSITQ